MLEKLKYANLTTQSEKSRQSWLKIIFTWPDGTKLKIKVFAFGGGISLLVGGALKYLWEHSTQASGNWLILIVSVIIGVAIGAWYVYIRLGRKDKQQPPEKENE